MNCEEANKIDLVNYLCSSRYTSPKIKHNDYWYLSPLRDEKTASFKIERNKNVWYDHGTGKGGKMIHFVIQFFNCQVQTALQKLNAHVIDSKVRLLMNNTKENIRNNNNLSFQQQKHHQTDVINHQTESPFHLHENSLVNHRDAAETAIQIIVAKKPITDSLLCRYLEERCINKNIADAWCNEVRFKLNNNKEFVAIGFKNNAGGYELRNEIFKLSSTPKYVTYISNNDTNNNPNLKTQTTEILLPDLRSNQFKLTTKISPRSQKISNKFLLKINQ